MDALTSGQYRFLAYGGAIRGGKTVAGLAAIFVLCKAYPGSRWAIVRKDLPTLRRNTIPSFNKLRPRPYVGDINRSDWIARCANGSEIVFFTESIEEDPDLDRWKGLEVNGFLLEEANELQEKSWFKAQERAGAWVIPDTDTQPDPMILLTFNPTFSWPRRVFYEPWAEGKLKAPYYYRPANANDNPHLPQAYTENLKNLPEHEYKRFVLGDWGAVEGQAFSEWRTGLHVSEFPRPQDMRDWNWYAGLDWGYRAPGCLVLVAMGPDDQVRVRWDWYFREMTAGDVGRQAAEHFRRIAVPIQIAGDSAMWAVTDGGPTVAEQFQEGLRSAWGHGMPMLVKAPKGPGSRQARVVLTHELLRWEGAEDTIKPWQRPRLTFHPDAKNLIRTLPALMVDPNDTEDVDTDGDDHGWDALTYCLMIRPQGLPSTEPKVEAHRHPGFRDGARIKGEPPKAVRFRTVFSGRE